MKYFIILLTILLLYSCEQHKIDKLIPPNTFPEECSKNGMRTHVYPFAAGISAVTIDTGYCFIGNGLTFIDTNGVIIKNITPDTRFTALERGDDGIFCVNIGSYTAYVTSKYNFNGDLIWTKQVDDAYVIKPLPGGRCFSYGHTQKPVLVLYDASGTTTTLQVDTTGSLSDIDHDPVQSIFRVLYSRGSKKYIAEMNEAGIVLRKTEVEGNAVRVFPGAHKGHNLVSESSTRIKISYVDTAGSTSLITDYPFEMSSIHRIIKTADRSLLFLSNDWFRKMPRVAPYTTVFTSQKLPDVHVVRVSQDGFITWDKKFGAASLDTPLGIEEDGSGFISILGNAVGYSGDSRISTSRVFIQRVDRHGNTCRD